MTCRRDRLPKGIPNCYFHKVTTAPGETKACVACFNNSISVVKHLSLAPHAGPVPTDRENSNPTTPPIKYTKVHVTFQSTSSCNITTVNALNQNSLFVVQKERGSRKQKRKWVIEMNCVRQLYLPMYGRIDTMDNLIKKCHSWYYCSWKYWHSAKNHGLSLAVVVCRRNVLASHLQEQNLELRTTVSTFSAFMIFETSYQHKAWDTHQSTNNTLVIPQ
jgi:hypothetical protein